MDIKRNLEDVLKKIEIAEKKSISGEKVELIAVTKTHGIDIIKEAIELGITDIGENKVQEFTTKYEKLGNDVNFHMIGTLQSNKVKYIYDKAKLIHSLDRMSLAKEIERKAQASNIIVNCLVQVNISNEESKGGVSFSETEKFIESLLDFKNLKIVGLMGIAKNTDDLSEIRDSFRRLYNLKEKIKKQNIEELEMKYLSMGMSSDFEMAIEEGSNMVRIGSSIFGKRDY
ncbi:MULTISPECIES: YggS family pyridoxal phosphate-dependent enzyme [Peptoniphilus]|uniref:YggS family pyridoxal phosphate-dependent enzyme n=1 Tax=Peptoniphilus TaxID=162289 RepID=UPI0003B7FAF9|nr:MULTISPECIES: YggS family pyridoxal phosphate-dependent enzyme [Peptoniphilus]ERT63278.1 pyridoxal phosphate enzyme, YggS family [Peptoniphilus sp. BV3AC2]MDK8275925.1 YggS family pyridoxal phosphate-dependent enzyme [Peptoniphilus duerdenii]